MPPLLAVGHRQPPGHGDLEGPERHLGDRVDERQRRRAPPGGRECRRKHQPATLTRPRPLPSRRHRRRRGHYDAVEQPLTPTTTHRNSPCQRLMRQPRYTVRGGLGGPPTLPTARAGTQCDPASDYGAASEIHRRGPSLGAATTSRRRHEHQVLRPRGSSPASLLVDRLTHCAASRAPRPKLQRRRTIALMSQRRRLTRADETVGSPRPRREWSTTGSFPGAIPSVPARPEFGDEQGQAARARQPCFASRAVLWRGLGRWCGPAAEVH